MSLFIYEKESGIVARARKRKGRQMRPSLASAAPAESSRCSGSFPSFNGLSGLSGFVGHAFQRRITVILEHLLVLLDLPVEAVHQHVDRGI
jgi:hypothetical protein